MKSARRPVVITGLGCVTPLGRDAARVLDLVVAGAGCDHRPHHGVARHGEVHHHGLVVDLHGPLDGRVHVGIGLYAVAAARFANR